jgi:hypothetical protein
MGLEIAKQVWKDKWETLLALIGASATLWSSATWPWKIVWSVVGLLLVVDVVGTVIHEVRMARERNVPLVVFVPPPKLPEGSVLDAYNSMVGDVTQVVRRAGFEEGEFVQRFKVTRDEWVLWRDTSLPPNPQEWQREIRRFSLRVHRLAYKLGEQRIFHIFLRCPAAMAVGLGAALGTHYDMSIYHYQKDMGRKKPGKLYVPIFDHAAQADALRVRLGELLSEPYQTITVEEQTAVKPEMYVSLFVARHDPRSDLEQVAQQNDGGVVRVRRNTSGALQAEDDWLLIARETAGLLLNLIALPEVDRIHLALSCPVPLALLIGCALGTHSAITVHNWFEREGVLSPVLSLDQLGRVG